MTGQHLLALLLPCLLLPLFVLSCKLKLQMKLNINIISQHLKRNGIMIMKRETPKKFGGSTLGGGVLQHEKGQERGEREESSATNACRNENVMFSNEIFEL